MPTLKILTPKEKEAFDSPPLFKSPERKKYFKIHQSIQNLISDMSESHKIGFILQLGYFRYSQKFFSPNQSNLSDIKYVQNQLRTTATQSYNRHTLQRHRKIILAQLQAHSFKSKHDFFETELKFAISKHKKPVQIFDYLVKRLSESHIEIPKYNTFSEIITHGLNSHETNIITAMKSHLSSSDIEYMESIFNDKQKKDAIFNKISHSTKLGKIRASLEDLNQVKELYHKISSVIDVLQLSEDSIRYHAIWAMKSRRFQLQQFTDPYKRYFHLITFICHHYMIRQDTLIDIMASAVTSRKHAVERAQENLYFNNKKGHNYAIKEMNLARKSYKETLDKIKGILKDSRLSKSDKITKINLIIEYNPIETPEQLELFGNLEKSVTKSLQNLDWHDLLESASRTFQSRASDVIKHVEFNEETSDSDIIEAINYFKLKDGVVSKSAPIGFLDDKKEQDILYDEEHTFRGSLYKVLLFLNIIDAIKAGKLSLKQSYKFLSIDEYLIDKKIWAKDKDALIERAGIKHLISLDAVLEPLKKELDQKYHTTNKNIRNGTNTHARFSKKGRLIVETPKVEKTNTSPVSSLFSKCGVVSIVKILSDINQLIRFTDCFDHYSIKHSKKKPSIPGLFAGIIGLGCNIGVQKLSKISRGILENVLGTTVDWYFSIDNVTAANNKILSFMDALRLPDLFLKIDDIIHTSSDTLRVGVCVDSINSSHSFKYFGHGSGAKINSFIDERSLLYYTHVLTSSEGEAPGLIDGLLHNDVIKSDIHSTDTHGYSEAIFALTHMIDVYFAPRIKNFQDQAIYSFLPRSHYVQEEYDILPKQCINLQLIQDNWDDSLRLLVTIKLKHTSASQIFKRMNSYSKNPLYMALKEFGRITKSIFILRYIDDVELRQAIEKQLNKSELSNKMSRAIRFGNDQELGVSTQEEQNMLDSCRCLIQNAIILWNYLYLSELILNAESEEKRQGLIETITNGSIMVWAHINLLGEYNFSSLAKYQGDPFNVPKIMELKIV